MIQNRVNDLTDKITRMSLWHAGCFICRVIINNALKEEHSGFPDVAKFATSDRFLIIDDTVYHFGASFKDLGRKLCAFSKMEAMTADELLKHLE